MKTEILGRAIGRCLSNSVGLNAVYLPAGVPTAVAEAIVREANSMKTLDPPFAILVSEAHPVLEDSLCPRVWPPEDVISYRQDERLAVVSGRHTDLQSVASSFAEVLGLSFPALASNQVTLVEIAAEAISIVLDEASITGASRSVRKLASRRLANCLSQLAEIHESSRLGDETWNTYWFEHANIALNSLIHFLVNRIALEPAVSIEDVLARYMFAAFGLPNPGKSGALPAAGLGKKYAAAVDEWWLDENAVDTALAHLRHHPDFSNKNLALAELRWDKFDQDVAVVGHPLIALMRQEFPNHEAVEAFADLTPAQFFDPTNRGKDKQTLVVAGPDGDDFSVSGSAPNGPFLVRSESRDGHEMHSEMVRISVPTLATPTPEEVNSSQLTFSITPTSVSWDGDLEVAPDGSLWAVGRFSRDVRGKRSKPFLPATVRVSRVATDSLAAHVPASSACVVHILPDEGVGLLIYRMGAKRVPSRPVYLGPAFLNIREPDSDQSAFAGILDEADSDYQIVVWGERDEVAPLLNGKPIEGHMNRSGINSASVKPSTLDVCEIRDRRFELRASEHTSSLQSPIVAAIGREEVSGNRPKDATVESVRGVFEQLLASNLGSPEWRYANGHTVVIGNEPEIPLAGLSAADGAPEFLMNPSTRALWNDFVDDEVPDALLNSEQAEDFRIAFLALGIQQSLQLSGDDSAIDFEWPSRTSWRHLWLDERHLLNRYLAAYSALVDKARAIGSPLGVFWATYPFSVSVWTSGSSLQSSAVLLSPLHPVRLAWLASVEGTLRNSKYAHALAGTVEGWNLPIFGPRHTKSGRMVAIPMDTGEGQIFLGWSMLVAASVDDELPLIAPHRIGPLPAPGTAASGLNATAATSALRSYRRMHPHVSTLTIDLAASIKTPRLNEVDESVLAQLEAWSKEKTGDFRGGARVLDSLCREGEVPFRAVADLAKKNPDMPLLWSRYSPGAQSQTCNIRLLQDSGVAIVVGQGNSSNLGVIGQTPLRRFEASEAPSPMAKRARSRPSIEPGHGGWVDLEAALAAVETSEDSPQITSKLHRSVLVDDRADWTVSGESLLSPSAMATLIQGNGEGSQMLWEWRPPFLEATADVPVLERRPFVSVARVPQGFQTELKRLLERSTGRETSDDAVRDLLGKLGARGVGLSSLLAMGGTHAAGALGFYLSFAFAELLDGKDGAEYLALPIDACDTFLKALAGSIKGSDPTQRADLLILRLDDDSLTLVPVEIKFYGMDAAGDNAGDLPRASDGALGDARDQLVSTLALLRGVETNGKEVSSGDPHDRALWLNALGTLVEAAVRLKPAGALNSPLLSARLQSLLAGDISVNAGRPIINYFKHDSYTETMIGFRSEVGITGHPGLNQYGALVANSAHAFAAVQGGSSGMLEAWIEIADWAFDTSTPNQPSVSPLIHDNPPKSEVPVPVPGTDASRSTVAAAEAPQEESNSIPRLDPEGAKFAIGELSGTLGHAQAAFWPGNTALNQMNIGVVGDLGTGKTQLSKALIYQLRRTSKLTQINPLSVLIFDYKEDFQDAPFLSAVGGVVLKPHRIPLNIFALEGGYSPRAAFQRASSFFDTIAKIYPGVGAVQRDRLTTVITDLYEELDGEAPTLAEVRQKYIELDKPDSVTGILNTFVKGEVFSDDRSELVTFDELLHDRVLIVALSDFGADQNSKNSLVALFLNVYYDHMRRATKWPFEGTAPQTRKLNSFLLVDEATNIMKYEFDVLMDLMLQGREFGFGVILSSQYLSHFKPSSSTNYGEPLLTWFIHKVPNVTLKQLEQLGIPGASQSSAASIATLPLHGAFYASLDYPGRFVSGTPFFRILESRESGDE